MNRFYLVAVAALILHAAPSVVADTRLESHSFGNIDRQQFVRQFPALDALLIDGHVVPGLHENFVPQGIDFLETEPGMAVLSGYFCERFQRAWWRAAFIRRCVQKQSAFYLFDLEAGEAVRLAMLHERDGKPMRRHAGGVASLHERLWLPDNFEILRFDPAELLDADTAVIEMRPENENRIGVDSSGDFVTTSNGTLWIGNFQRGDRGRPLPTHYRAPNTETLGWTTGYRIDPDTLRPVSQQSYTVSFAGQEYEVYRPDAALHHRNKVQGMSFVGDRHLVLISSFGGASSTMSFHTLLAPPLDAPLDGTTVTLPDGSKLRAWSISLFTRENVFAAPPGAEGVAYDGKKLVVLFEGGAMPYRQRWNRIEDRMLLFLPPGRFLR